MTRSWRFAGAFFAAGLLVAGSGLAAYDAYLEFDGLRGASQDARHPDEVGVLSFSWGVPHAGPSIAAASQIARAAERELTFAKVVDRASPLLASAQASARRFPRVMLKTRYATYQLHDVVVTSCRTGDSRGGVATETITLAFTTWQQGPPTLAPVRHLGAAVLAPTPAGEQP